MSERREQRAAEQLQRISDRWTTMSGNGVAHTPARNDVIVPSAAEFREHGLSADSAAQVLAVHYRLGSCLAGAPGPLTSTGKADAVKANEGHQQAAPIPDAAKPTYKHPARKSPWWMFV